MHILETPYEPALCSIIGNTTIYINLSGIDIMQEELLKSQVSSGKPPKNIGLLNSVINILTTLPDDLIHDRATDMVNVDPCNLNLDEALTSEKFNKLEDICNSLKLLDENRWGI